MPVLRINTDGLDQLRVKLAAMPEASRTAFRDGLKAGGELVATEAKAQTQYSAHIPSSISVEVANEEAVRVTTRLPEAVAIENKGKGHVRHPLFGTRQHWYQNPQPAFLHPALARTRKATRALLINTVNVAFRAVGLDLKV